MSIKLPKKLKIGYKTYGEEIEQQEEYNEDHVIRCPDCMSLVYPWGRECKSEECSEDETN